MCRFKLSLLRILIVGLLSGLTACNTIEHQSEKLPKGLLPVLRHVSVKAIWTAHPGSGVAKADAKLRLAIKGRWLVIADQKGTVYALDPATGEKRWTVAHKTLLTSGPSIVDEQVFVSTEDGRLLSMDLQNGTLLWQSPLNSPAFSAIVGNQQRVFVHTLSDTLIALDLKTGHRQWHYAATIPSLILRRSSAPMLYQDLVLVGLSSGRLVALNQSSGMPEWQKEVALSQGRSEAQRMVDISADPILQGGIVYVVTYQGKMAALKANNGDLLWEHAVSSYAGLGLLDRTIVVPDHRGILVALDAISGKERWKQSVLSGRRLTKPLCLEKVVLVGDDEGFVHWLDLQTGVYKGRISVDSRGIEASPVLKEDRVYLLGLSGKVTAFAAASFK